MATLSELADQYTVAVVKEQRLSDECINAEKNLVLLKRELSAARSATVELGERVLWAASGECE